MTPWVRPEGILCLAGVDEVGRGPLAGLRVRLKPFNLPVRIIFHL